VSVTFFGRSVSRFTFPFLTILILSCTALAATPIVTITSPAPNSQTTSPVNFVASATSPGCSQGIQAMRIYSAPHVGVFTTSASKINTYVNLPLLRTTPWFKLGTSAEMSAKPT
jgi:hypothetical protein